jgi:hypothetical protein
MENEVKGFNKETAEGLTIFHRLKNCWWDNEDEFIKHDREQSVTPTIESLDKPIITSTPLGGKCLL